MFKMKKTILALLALGVVGANSAFATAVTTQNQPATHAKITVNGEVVTQTCEISTNDRNKVVTLDKVGTNSLKQTGDVAAQQLVTIHLENCTVTNGVHTPHVGTVHQTTQNKVSVTFNHTEKVDTANQFTLKNIETNDPATNVNIQFANINGNGLKIGQNDADAKLSVTDLSTTPAINFLARYYATGQSQAGKVKAEAELDLAYE